MSSARRVLATIVAGTLAATCITMWRTADHAVLADSQPVDPADPATPATVSADALPTVQIDGVAWSQAVVGDTVYVGGRFANARPAGARPAPTSTARSNFLAYDLTDRRADHLVRPVVQRTGAHGRRVARRHAPLRRRRLHLGRTDSPRSRIAAFDCRPPASRAVLPVGRLPRAWRSPCTRAARRCTWAATSTRSAASSATSSPRSHRQRRTARLGAQAPAAWSRRSRSRPTAPRSRSAASSRAQRLEQPGLRPRHGRRGHRRQLLPMAINNTVRNGGNTARHHVARQRRQRRVRFGPLVSAASATSRARSPPRGTAARSTGSPTATATPTRCSCRAARSTTSGTPRVRRPRRFPDQRTNEPVELHRAHRVQPGRHRHPRREPYGYFNFAGQPAPSRSTSSPRSTQGTFTGQNQGPWHVAGNSQYVVMGGEFRNVNDAPQQGLVRFAVSSIAPNDRRRSR
jgi:hypothetical protein